MVSSVSKLLDVMHKQSKELDRKSLERSYEVYIRSKLEYASTVLNDSFKHDKNAYKLLLTASSKYCYRCRY